MIGIQKRSDHIICFRFCLALTLSRHIVLSFYLICGYLPRFCKREKGLF